MKMLALALAPALVCAAAATATARAAVRDCGAVSRGPATLPSGAVGGPTCLLQSFRACRPAVFTLATFGVDTVDRDVLRVVRVGAGCRGDVDRSLRVVPRPAHVFEGSCRTVERRAGEVVVAGCRGLFAATIVLGL